VIDGVIGGVFAATFARRRERAVSAARASATARGLM
jgi:hypothetical protein